MNSKEQIISIDVGTSKIKVVKYKHEKYYFEEFFRVELDYVISRAIEKEYTAVLITGSGASSISDEQLIGRENNVHLYRYNELECVANIVKSQGYTEGLVVNIGTGTSFLYYNAGAYQHISGTGIGGGTFEGLSKRLLNEDDLSNVESLAQSGHIENVNLVIKDLYSEKLGWLEDDITVSNFAKKSSTHEDIALGIHSLVIEPIMSITKGIVHFKPMNTIIFTGGVMNNRIIHQLVEKYARFFQMNIIPYTNPSYGTALGALQVYWNNHKQKDNN
jgi:type II pantothenate kinase